MANNLRLKASRKYPNVPVINDDPAVHTAALVALKESMEIGQRRTPDLFNSFVRVQDLLDLGLIDLKGNTQSVVGADLSQIANIGDLTAAATGDFLRYNGTVWVNDQIHNGDITQAMVTQHEAALTITWGQITGAPAAGEANDGLNIGYGTEIFKDKVGVNLRFKTLVEGANITITEDADEVTIAASGGGGGGSNALAYANSLVPPSNTVENTDTETSFSSTYLIPADTLETGSLIRVRLFGVYSTDASVAPTARVRLKLEGDLVLDTDVVTTDTSVVNGGWNLDAWLLVRDSTSTSPLEAQGHASFSSDSVSIANDSELVVDTTVDNTITASWEWDIADTDNTATLRMMTVHIEQAAAVDTELWVRFDPTGAEEEYVIPAGYTSCTAYVVGAAGGQGIYNGGGNSGAGGYSFGAFSITPAETLRIRVGEGGNGGNKGTGGDRGGAAVYPGGGNGAFGDTWCGAGGGYSGVFRDDNSPLVIAGGGGGGSGFSTNAGAGGGTTGATGFGDTSGGSQVAGGTGAYPGSAYQGGNANGGDNTSSTGFDCGGGGGGFYGGGASNGDGRSASGGSGYIDATVTGNTYVGSGITPPTELPMTIHGESTAGLGVGVVGATAVTNIAGLTGGSGAVWLRLS